MLKGNFKEKVAKFLREEHHKDEIDGSISQS